MRNRQLSLLLIEENDEDAFFFEHILKKNLRPYSCKITRVTTLTAASELLRTTIFDLIISNLFLTDSKGLVTLQSLHTLAPSTPIVIITDSPSDLLAIEVVASGAQDYIAKSEVQVHFFIRMVQLALERHQQQELLREFSFTDELTEVYNRRGFFSLAEQQVELAHRTMKGFFLFLIDVDRLKEINDIHGHQEGDAALIETAEQLRRCFRSSDIVGRVGGDEFAILAFSDTEHQPRLIENLEKTFQEYNAQKLVPYQLTVSSGCAFYDPASSDSLEELFALADKDLYKTKKVHHTF